MQGTGLPVIYAQFREGRSASRSAKFGVAVFKACMLDGGEICQ